MSYILNALKRAEHERQRGQLPDPLAPTGPEAIEHRNRSWPSGAAPWLGMALVVAGALAMGWFLGRGRGDAPASPVGSTAPQASQPPQPASAPPAPLSVASAPPAPSTPPALGATGPTRSPDASPVAEPLRAAPPVTPPSPVAAPTAPVIASPPAPSATARTSAMAIGASGPRPQGGASSAAPVPSKAVAASSSTPPQRPLAWRALPEELRRQLPPLKVGGSMYSAQPSSRLLVIDGQAVREGDSLAPDLVLEHIGPNAAVLRLREQRFEITY